MPEKRLPKSERELKFVKELATAPTATAAARAAGYADPVQSAWELKQRLDISRCLNEAGITPNLLMERLKEGLEATKEGKTGEIPDYSTRHRYLTTALELHGFLAQADAGAKAVAISTSEERPIGVRVARYLCDTAVDVSSDDILKAAEKKANELGSHLADRVVIIPQKRADTEKYWRA